MEDASKIFFTSNIIIALLLGSSMQALWGAINVFQIIFALGLTDIRHLANVKAFWKALSSMLNF
jgi:hypothetical protein